MTKTRKELLEELLADAPDDPELYYALAMEEVSAGDDAGAVRRFREMFARLPDYAPAYHQGGLALARLGQANEARLVLQRGIASAQKAGNLHAADEMRGLLDSLQ